MLRSEREGQGEKLRRGNNQQMPMIGRSLPKILGKK